MKKMLVLPSVLITVLFFTITAKAQTTGFLLSPVLDNYFAVKNALVAGDAAGAAKYAASFSAAVSAVDISSMKANESNFFKSAQAVLLAESKSISSSKELAKQRDSFSKLSESMITLAKNVKLDTKPVYVEYCPMKKASWLSAEQAIKNPYYGSAMLTCGKVTDTLK